MKYRFETCRANPVYEFGRPLDFMKVLAWERLGYEGQLKSGKTLKDFRK